MVLLLYGCGLRTHELCGLNVEHVRAAQQELDLLTAKGGPAQHRALVAVVDARMSCTICGGP